MDKLAEHLFRYIQDQNITQKDAAKMLGVSRSTLTNWKHGGEIDAKKAEAIREFTKDWELDEEGLDAINQALLSALKELSLVDRCRLLAFADDLKNAAKAARTAPASAPAATSIEVRPVEAKPETPAAKIKKNNGPEIRCPHCHEWLYGSYVPGEKFNCPECGQHIVIHHIAKQEN